MEDAALCKVCSGWLWSEGLFFVPNWSWQGRNNADHAKFRDYFDYDEPLSRVPSHRAGGVQQGAET
jgi:uncharacterized protein